MRAEQDLIPKGLRTEQLSIERGGVTISVASVEPSAARSATVPRGACIAATPASLPTFRGTVPP